MASPRQPKAASVKVKIDGNGLGRTILNGYDISKFVNGIHLSSTPGDLTMLSLGILVDEMEVDAEAVVQINEYRTKAEGPLPHDFVLKNNDVRFCNRCRMFESNPKFNPSECPGEPEWYKREKLRLGARMPDLDLRNQNDIVPTGPTYFLCDHQCEFEQTEAAAEQHHRSTGHIVSTTGPR